MAAAWDEKVKGAYRDYEFHLAYHATMQLCAVDLSAVYFDVIKDRLYTWRKDGQPRRSAQTALWMIAQDVIRLLAPILSFTASEAWGHLPGRPAESVWLAGLPAREAPRDPEALEARHRKLLQVRAAVHARLEEARPAKLIRNSLQAAVTVSAEGQHCVVHAASRADLLALFLASSVTHVDGVLAVQALRPPSDRCERS